MIDGYKIISVTPAGRRKFLEVLIPNILNQKGIIDEHHFWINTNKEKDKAYIRDICKKNSFFKRVSPTRQVRGISSIGHFFKSYTDEKCIYVRFDDDICFVADDAIEKLVKFRIEHPEYFLVYPHIANNSMNKIKFSPFSKFSGTGIDDWYWGERYINNLHNFVLNNINNLDNFKTKNIESNAILNINCICWFGKEFKKFGGNVPSQEEKWLANIYPNKIKKMNGVCGESFVVHYAFKTQRTFLNDSILNKYLGLRKNLGLL